MIIDAHIHLGPWIVNGKDYGYDKDKIKQLMKKFKIDKVCAQIIGLDELFKMPKIEERNPNNEIILESCKNDDSLIPIFWLNPFKNEEIIEGLKRGFKGLKYHARVHLLPSSDKKLGFAIETAKKFDVPIFIHTSERSEHTSIFRIQEVAERYPDVNFFAVHSINKVNVTCFEAKKCGLYDLDNIFYCTGGGSMFLEFKVLYENVGPEHIVLTSDLPFGHPGVYIKNIELLTDNKKEREMMLGKNIQRILKL